MRSWSGAPAFLLAGVWLAAASGPLSAAEVDHARWAFQFKRQATASGTADETTKSQLKLEYFPDGAVNLLRLEVPLPDEETDFSGSPLNPRLGDVKLRAGWRAVPALGLPWASFAELTLPTADPESLGSGKVQVSLGVRHTRPWWEGNEMFRHSAAIQIQQVVSVAGDEARSDVNQTKFELEWRGLRPSQHYLKLTGKPVIDWVNDGKTGAVLELEGGMPAGKDWTLALLGGHRLWGEGIAGTYGKRLEFKATCRF